MKSNDKKIASQVEGAYDVKAVCDDGNVHVTCKNHNTADEVQTHFGHIVTSDGVQEGVVQVWLGDVLAYDNN